MGKDDKLFVVQMVSLVVGINMTIHPFWMVQIASLIADKAFVTISVEYSDFADVFSPKSVAKLLQYTGIDDLSIELINNRQPSYWPIYSLGPVQLETLKIYIEANLANDFMRLSKSPAGASILFI